MIKIKKINVAILLCVFFLTPFFLKNTVLAEESAIKPYAAMSVNKALDIVLEKNTTEIKVVVTIDVFPKVGNWTADDLVILAWDGDYSVKEKSTSYTNKWSGDFWGKNVDDNDVTEGKHLSTNKISFISFPLELKTTFWVGWRSVDCNSCKLVATFVLTNLKAEQTDKTIYAQYYHKKASVNISNISASVGKESSISISGTGCESLVLQSSDFAELCDSKK